jgi:diguanylate cyclase (GGDEF)-like protein
MALMSTDRELSAVLSVFAPTIASDFSVPRTLDRLVKKIVTILPIGAAGVTLISPPSAPRYLAASNDLAQRCEALQGDVGDGPCFLAYRTGQWVEISDFRREERFARFVPRALEIGLGAVFAFPLKQGEERIGVLDLYRETPGPLGEDDISAAQTLADVATAYIVTDQVRTDLGDLSDRSRASLLHDALTGLANRTLFLERLTQALLRSGRSGTPVAVLSVDLDRFTGVNDEHGRRIGDDVLIAAAQRIAGQLRPGDTLARLSGDEFLVLCEEVADTEQASVIAHRIVVALAEPFALSGHRIPLSASVGIAVSGRGTPNPEGLLLQADIARRQAKKTGGDRHQVVDLREHDLDRHESSMERDVAQALGRGELALAYQPVVRTTDGAITGVEALLRWNSATRGPVAATTAIAAAERSGSILEIGQWALRQACADWHRWSKRSDDDRFTMAVNVSAHQLMAPEFVKTVAEVVGDTKVDPRRLILEITESAYLSDPARAFGVLTELKRLGVQLALDDFGTGYSSLTYLKQFPVDIIKLDQNFIAVLFRDRTSHAIVLKIIELAHLLELGVVSEGVESAEQAAEMTNLGSEFCQGNYFSLPLRPGELDVLMRRGAPGHTPRLPAPRRTWASPPRHAGPPRSAGDAPARPKAARTPTTTAQRPFRDRRGDAGRSHG